MCFEEERASLESERIGGRQWKDDRVFTDLGQNRVV